MNIAVICRVHCRCRCGRVFDRNTPTDEMAAHVRNAPGQCRIDKLLQEVVGFEPQTKDELENSLGVPAELIDLDPPINGLYYNSIPVWHEWVPW